MRYLRVFCISFLKRETQTVDIFFKLTELLPHQRAFEEAGQLSFAFLVPDENHEEEQRKKKLKKKKHFQLERSKRFYRLKVSSDTIIG